jgi:hypothetical protein
LFFLPAIAGAATVINAAAIAIDAVWQKRVLNTWLDSVDLETGYGFRPDPKLNFLCDLGEGRKDEN